jgi:hypothetical protein
MISAFRLDALRATGLDEASVVGIPVATGYPMKVAGQFVPAHCPVFGLVVMAARYELRGLDTSSGKLLDIRKQSFSDAP